MDYKILKRKLENAGVVFEIGLTLDEIRSIELRYNFTFPPDLKDFLLSGLPIGKGWINWRKDNDNEIQKRLDWPFEGICYDIKDNNFWEKSWGNKPESIDECFNQLRILVSNAPKLVPVYVHRYIPDRPNEIGNPIISAHQTDIIYYGIDLEDYLKNEFFGPINDDKLKTPTKRIDFWSDIIEGDISQKY